MCSTWRNEANTRNVFEQLLRAGGTIPVCPEQMGGLPTPRPPAEIVGGSGDDVIDGRARVMTQDGTDVTENYLRGAREVLKLAQSVSAHLVILKERSPSCGSREIYDGTFTRTVRSGCGVTTALLRRYGFEVVSDVEYMAAAAGTDT